MGWVGGGGCAWIQQKLANSVCRILFFFLPWLLSIFDVPTHGLIEVDEANYFLHADIVRQTRVGIISSSVNSAAGPSETTARHNSLADSRRFDGLTSYIHACILFGRAFPSSFDVDGDLFFFFFPPLLFYYYYHFQGLLLFAESRVVPILFDCLTVKVVDRVKVLGLIGEEQSRAHFPSTAPPRLPAPSSAMSAQRIESRNESRHRESFVRRGETSSSRS